jgi:imidazolonepropionase-like amidohydrolase
LVFGATILSCGNSVKHELVITNVNIIDLESGDLLEGRSVGIDSNRISKIYKDGIRTSGDSEEFDAKNGYLIPGLWDMHAHYTSYNSQFSKLLLANGVTGIREMWGDMDSTNYYRSKNKQGFYGPNIYSAGAIIDGVPPIWPGSSGVSNAEEAKAEVLRQIDEGVDFIKVYSGLSEEAFDAIADAANEQKIPFAGHVPNSTNIFHAMKKGMSSSEHVYGLLPGSSIKSDSLLQAGISAPIDPMPYVTTFNEQKFDSLCKKLAQSDMWLCPTFITQKNYSLLDNPEELQKSPLLKYIKQDLKFGWFVIKYDAFTSAELQKALEFQLKLLGKAHKKGVKILAGTDFPNPYTIPGFHLHDELELLVSAGIDELSVLRMAPSDAATFMKKTADFGTIKEGKIASLVLLSANPLENIANTRTIKAVVQRGQLYNQQALDELLASVEKEVANEPVPYSKVFKNLYDEKGINTALDSLTTLIKNDTPNFLLDEMDLVNIMRELLEKGDMNELTQFGEYMTIWFPESYRVFTWSGNAYIQAGNFEKAKEQLVKALELDPDNETTKMYLEELKNFQ